MNEKTKLLTKDVKDFKPGDFNRDIEISKRSRNIAIVSILVLLVSGAGVYWFAYRPYVIKKECSEKVRKIYRDDAFVNREEVALYETYFKACTNREGL